MEWNETPAELARAWAEHPVIMPGTYGDLYGVFTPAAPEAPPAGLCAIFFGRNRWWGDRLSVKSTRWLAAQGFSCLRFDYHGYGESAGECQNIHGERLYTDDALAAIRFMRKEFAQERFVLSGFCFDGRTALSALEEEGPAIEGVVCSSPEVTGAPGELLTHLFTLDNAITFIRRSASYKKVAISRALHRGLNLIKLAGAVGSREGLAERQISEGFKRDFRALLRSNARCLFLQGSDDPEYHGFQLVERSLLAKLTPEQKLRITLEVWPGKIHLLEFPEVQRLVAERVVSWIVDLRQTSPEFADARSFAQETKNGFHPSTPSKLRVGNSRY
jgi:alpha/beta superfamily hydrolase